MQKSTVKATLLLWAMIGCFSVSKAATVYFNTVYQGVGSYTVSSSSMTLAAQPITGSNFSFTDGLVNNSFGTGNNINGTFKYYDANGVLQSITGTVSRQDKSGNNTLGVYFYTNNTAYFFIIPGKESSYWGGRTFNTSGDPMGAALDNVVASTPAVMVSDFSLSAFSTCQGIASTTQTITVSGKNLIAGITVTAPTGFEVSKTSSASGFSGSLTLSPAGGLVNNTTIWVRLAAGSPGTYGPDIIISSSTNSNRVETTVSGTIYSNTAITAQPSTAVQNLCSGATANTLSVLAIGKNLTYQWYENTTASNSGGSPISGAINSSYTPTTNAAGTLYYYVEVSGDCGSAVISNVSGAVNVSAASLGGSISGGTTVCTGTNSSTLTLSGNVGNVLNWQSATDAAFSSPVNISVTSNTLTVTNLSATTYYRAVVSNGDCSSTYSSVATVTVSSQPTTSNAGSGTTICSGTNVTLNANTPSVGNGTWSIISGPDTNPAQLSSTTLPSAVFNPTEPGVYTLRWTITNGACSSSSDVAITVNSVSYVSIQPSPNAQAVCLGGNLNDLSVSANTSGLTYQWYRNTTNADAGGTLVATHTSVSGTTDTYTPSSATPGVFYYYVKVLDNSGCGEYTSVSGAITVYDTPTVANAGADQNLEINATLSANNPTVGSGKWTILNGFGGSFGSDTSPNSTFTGILGTTYTLQWTITNGTCTSTDFVDITVVPPTITINPSSLNDGTVGEVYSQQITATGGTPTYTYAVTGGALPAGLSLASDGTLTGTPSAGGTFNFTVTATDSSTGSGPYTGSRAYTLTIGAPNLSILPASLPNGTIGVSYSEQITASGGTSPYNYAITSGSLPAGLNLTSTGLLAGTPTAGGIFNFTVTATDSSTGAGPYTVSRAYTLTIDAPTLVISPITLPDGTVAAAYNQLITATGGTGSYSFALTAGTLPAGLSLASDGTLSGTPIAGGTFSFTVTATDSSTGAGPYATSQIYNLTVNAPTITISPSTLPNGTVNASYNQLISASGGTGPYSFAVTAGALPAGLSLASDGTLSGTPTAGGTFNFTVTSTDSSTGTGPYTGSRAYTLIVNAPTILISPSSLPAGTVATAYNQLLTASGGTGPYSFAVTAGALPAGLSLASDGTLSGTPTAGGTFNFTVTATDSSTGTGPYTGSRAYTLTINAPTISILPITLPAGSVATAYSQSIIASGGISPYSYSISAGSLPAGLSLSSGGTLSGTPTAGGTFNFTVTAIDSSIGAGPYTGSRAYTLIINAPTIMISPSSLPAGTVATAYSQLLTASGGTGPYSFAVTTGALPAGLSLASDGTLSGTPTAGGMFNFTVTATDSSIGAGPYTGSRTYTLTIAAPVITISPVSLPNGTVGVTYTQLITAGGGTAPYSFAVSTGALPAGINLAANGTLSGTPTVGGTFNFTVTATDSSTGSGPYTGSRAYSLIIGAPTSQAPTQLNLSNTSINENNALSVLIGNFSTVDPDANGPYTYTLVNGAGSDDNAVFSISGNALRAAASFNYEWKNSYSIRVRTTDQSGLSIERTFNITVNNVNEAPTDLALNRTAIYENNAEGDVIGSLSSTDEDAGDSFTYTLVSGDIAPFTIVGNQLKATGVFNYNDQSVYQIRIRTTDAGGLSYEKVFTITVLQAPTITATTNLPNMMQTFHPNQISISKGYTSQLNVLGSGLVSYQWTPASSLSAGNISNPQARPAQTTTYQVTVTNNQGISTVLSITLNVLEDYFISPTNTITPNADGINDVWVVDNLDMYPDHAITIFDKAGRVMYETKNYDNSWNGMLNGQPLTEGVYYYVIRFAEGKGIKKGYINLIRSSK